MPTARPYAFGLVPESWQGRGQNLRSYRVVVDFVLLEEAVEFIAGGDAQERAELVSGNAALPVGFEAEGLQSGAGRLLSGWQQGRRQIVGEGDRDLHGYSLAQAGKHDVLNPLWRVMRLASHHRAGVDGDQETLGRGGAV
jgi:hypothetical protein